MPPSRGARPRGLLRVDVQGTQARRFIVPALPGFSLPIRDLELFMGVMATASSTSSREGIDCSAARPWRTEGERPDRAPISPFCPRARPVASAEVRRSLRHAATVGCAGRLSDDRLPLPRRPAVSYRLSAHGERCFARSRSPLPSVLSVNGADTYRAAAVAGPRSGSRCPPAIPSEAGIWPPARWWNTWPTLLALRRRRSTRSTRAVVSSACGSASSSNWVAKEYASHIGPVATADIARSSH